MSGLASIRLDDVLSAARTRGASDLHLAARRPPMLRVDGSLQAFGDRAVSPDELRALGAELFGSEAVAERTISVRRASAGDLRVHGFSTQGVPAFAIRLLGTTVPALEALELPAVLERLSGCERGLMLFAGATGSGKSTTLAAVVDRINRTRPRRIITVEDPIEYYYGEGLSLISQRELGADADDLASALVGALRCDPDVIVVGELRTAADIHTALVAAETGHLVMATLHTGDVTQSVERIVHAFAGDLHATIRAQLAEVLEAVVCQRLVLRRGGRGRRPVAEVLVATDAIRNLIRDGRTHQLRNAIAMGRQYGMQLFEQHLDELRAAGAVDAEIRAS